MSRSFPLAGLLRLRALAEDRAAGALAAARREQRSAADRAGRTTDALGAWRPPHESDHAAWQAAVAARVALSSLLVEQAHVVARAEETVALRQEEWSAARTRTRAVERLQEKHDAAVATEEDRAEQLALDEVAARSTDLPSTGGAPDDTTGGGA